MAYILLIIIYIGFIGLGLPDSLFGAAWPAIYNEFGLHLSMGSVNRHSIGSVKYCMAAHAGCMQPAG